MSFSLSNIMEWPHDSHGTRAMNSQQTPRARDVATTANIYVKPNEASLERKLRDVYEGADN
ncbi:MAG: hypothetical protein M3327_13675 [Actinomycetota bacterium]|nr:hypothetical protein [Actinomycetota bacterium]